MEKLHERLSAASILTRCSSFGDFPHILNKRFSYSSKSGDAPKTLLKLLLHVPPPRPEIHQCCLMGAHQGQFTLLVRSRPPPTVFIPSSPLQPECLPPPPGDAHLSPLMRPPHSARGRTGGGTGVNWGVVRWGGGDLLQHSSSDGS